MRHSLKASLAALGALGALAFAPAAFAGCGPTSVQPANWDGGSIAGRLTPANFGVQGIVGLWSFSMVAGGQQIDFGYQQWHSDGTEIINSGGHSPASANFCLGAWKQTGPNTYHMEHFPLAFDPVTGAFTNRIIAREDVTIDATGNTFTGPFTLDIYDTTGTHLLAHIPGQVTGHRVLPN